MVNSQVTAEIVDALKLDVNVDKIPSPVPVVDVGRKSRSGFSYLSTSSATGTMSLAASVLGTDRSEVYVTCINLSIAKDNVCDIGTGTVVVRLTQADTGITDNAVSLACITLTAQASNITMLFDRPLKLLRNTAITCNVTFSVGTMSRSFVVAGFRDLIS